MNSKIVNSTNFNFRPSMATYLCEGAFQPNFARKRLKISKVLMFVKVLKIALKL